MHSLRKSKQIVLISLTIICLFTTCGLAQVAGEHGFWVSFVARCLSVESTLSFTEQDAPELSYYGTEFIAFDYQNHSIMLIGKDHEILTCDLWSDISSAQLSNAILKLANYMDNEEYENYTSDVSVEVNFVNGKCLMYIGRWILTDVTLKPMNDNITNEMVFDIIMDNIK